MDKGLIMLPMKNLSASSQLQPMRIPLQPLKLLEPKILTRNYIALQPMQLQANNTEEKVPKLNNVMFELTKACNLNCIYCYCNAGHPRVNELSFNEIKKLIDYISSNGVNSITLTGGEPLLHADFINIIRYASSAGLKITLFTNGTLFTKNIFAEILKSNLQSIQISLDGATSETHDSIRGNQGLFDKTLEVIKDLKQGGFSVILMTTLIEQNQDEIIGIGELCEQLQIDGWCMNMFMPIGRATYLKPVSYQKLSEIRKQIGVSPVICNTTACGVGFEKIAVLSDGQICPCEVVQTNTMGNIREDDLIDIFQNHNLMIDYRQSTIENVPECLACPVNELCRGGCKSSALIRNGSIYTVDPTSCYSWLQKPLLI